MITKVSHVTFFVLDQQKAYDFYVTTLGFKVNTDATMENGFRWLTVTPPEQPDLEIALLPPLEGNMMGYDEETRNAFRILLDNRAKRRLRTRRGVSKQLRRSSELWAPAFFKHPTVVLPMRN